MAKVHRTGRWLLAGALCIAPTAGCKSGVSIPIWNPFASKNSTPTLAQSDPNTYTQPQAPKAESSWTAPFKKFGEAVAAPFKSSSDKGAAQAAANKTKIENDPISLASKTTPPNANLYVSLAKLQERSGNFAAAVEEYDKALDADPKHLPALLGLAHLFDRQGRYDEALVLYGKAVAAHPNDATAQNDYGLCLARSNKMSESAVALRKAVTLEPEKVLYRNNLATVLVELDRADEAYQTLVVAHGESIAHYNVGFLLNKRNRKAEALRHFELAAQIDPNFKEAKQWVEVLGNKSPAVDVPATTSTRPAATPANAPLTTPIATPVPPQSWTQPSQTASRPVPTSTTTPYPSTSALTAAEPRIVAEANSQPVATPTPTPTPSPVQIESTHPPVSTPTIQPISRPTVVEPAPATGETVGPRLLGNEQSRYAPTGSATAGSRYAAATTKPSVSETNAGPTNVGPLPPLPEQVSTLPVQAAAKTPTADRPTTPAQSTSSGSAATTAAKYAPSRY